MKILVDTNIVLDIAQKREPHFVLSYNALHKAIEANAVLLVTASAATDIFYLLRKHFHSAHTAKSCIERLSGLAVFADVLGSDIQAALTRNMSDFEDAVADVVAKAKRRRLHFDAKRKGLCDV